MLDIKSIQERYNTISDDEIVKIIISDSKDLKKEVLVLLEEQIVKR